PVILAFEGHALAVEGDESAIGNSSPVCVTGKVAEYGIGSAKRSLGIDDPFDLAQCGEEGLEGCRLGEGGLVGEELPPASLVGCSQTFQEQATEEAREHLNGEEEAGPAGNPGVAMGRDAGAGDDDVGVRMWHPPPQYPERRYGCSGLLPLPPASWCDPPDPSQTEAGRWGGLCHGPSREATEDSRLDAVVVRWDQDLATTALG